MSKIEKLKEVKKVLENGLSYKFFIYGNSIYFYDEEVDFMDKPTLNIEDYNEVAFIGNFNRLYVNNDIYCDLDNINTDDPQWHKIMNMKSELERLDTHYC